MRIRDLDYVAAPPEISDIVLVYHYRSEVMRRAMRNALARRLAESSRKLVACSPPEFADLLNPGSLFDPTDLVPFIDFGYAPESDQADQIWKRQPVEFVKGLLAKGTDSAAVVFLSLSDVVKLEAAKLWPLNSRDKIEVIEAVVQARKNDIPRIVQAVASLRKTAADRKVIAATVGALQDLWFDKTDVDTLADAADRQLTIGQSAALSRSVEGSSNILLSALGNVLSGKGGRDDVLGHFEAYRDGGDIVTQLLSATARRTLMTTRSSASLKRRRGTEQLAAWTLLLISRLKDLASASGTRSLWPSADLRIHDLQILLDTYLEVSWGPAKATTFFNLEALSDGAKVARQISLELSERLASRLDLLLPGNPDPDEPFWFALIYLKRALNGELTVRRSQSGGNVPALTSFDQWIGGEAVPFVFLQHFASRRFERPLLLVGPDNTGKRVAANLMSRLYVCKVATPDQPTACGQCIGCGTAEFSIARIDVLAHLGAGADKFVEDAVAARGTVAGLPVNIIHGVEHVSHNRQDRLLKEIESGQLSGLTILTTRDRSSLLDALRSRCLTVMFWPLRLEELSCVEIREREAVQSHEPRASLGQGSAGRIAQSEPLQ